MKLLLLFLSFLILPFREAYSKKNSSAVWGKIIQAEKNIEGLNYKYFVYYEIDKTSHAYPIDTNRKDISEAVKKSVGQNVRIEGEVKQATLPIDGPKKVILVFIPTMVKPLSLSELAINDPIQVHPYNSASISKKESKYDGGGIRINDDVANAMIYTGAAVILGTQLKNLLIKK